MGQVSASFSSLGIHFQMHIRTRRKRHFPPSIQTKWSQLWLLQNVDEFFRVNQPCQGWYRTVSSLWHNIIWNDIEQHAFGAKLLARFSFDSTKFIALIPRSFKPLWHKLRLAFVCKGDPPLSFLFLYLKLLFTVYASTSHLFWVTKRNRKMYLNGVWGLRGKATLG